MLSQALLQKCRSFFLTQEDVVGLWLYGSRAEGTHHRKSDWDIAILFSSMDASLNRLARLEDLRALIAGLLHVADNLVQVIDLAQAPIPLAFEVVQNQELLQKHSDKVIFFEQKIFSIYELDYYHHYKQYA